MKLPLFLVMFAAGLAASPPAAADWNWADDPAAQDPRFAESRAVCERLRDRLLPPLDPSAMVPDAECDSEALYYGIGVAADPAAAYRCARVEAGQAPVHGLPGMHGAGMLMTIHANGVGGERDLDLATALACRMSGAPGAVHGRVRHLQRMKMEPVSAQAFSYCDDITSGAGMAVCARHQARLDEDRRNRRLGQLQRHWRPAEQTAFEPLLAQARTFARTSAEHEVDLSGSGRWAFVAQHEQRLLDVFVSMLELLEAEGLPSASDTEYRAADTHLNEVYRQVMALQHDPAIPLMWGSEDSLPFSSVTRSGVREAQRAWTGYRDAWLAFAAERYWQKDDALGTWLTRQRTDFLAAFVPDPGD